MSTAIAIGTWLIKNWKLALVGFVVAVLLGSFGYVALRMHNLKTAAETAVRQRDVQTYVAESNRRAAEDMQAHEAAQAKARKAISTAKVSRDTKVKVIEQENHHAPGNDTAAGPSWDALGDRLRELAADAKD